MANNYKYPRVTISTKALNHSSVAPEAADTTVLFVPICTPKGPKDKIVKLHSISDLENIFGRLDYKESKQAALNVYQWLSAGGTVYLKRLNDGTPASSTNFKAIAPGKFYDGLKVHVEKHSLGTTENPNNLYSVKLSNDRNVVLFESRYIKNVKDALSKSGLVIATEEITASLDETLSGGSDLASGSTEDSLLESYLDHETSDEAPSIYIDLANRLETPVDVILDAGYSEDIKKKLLTFIVGGDADITNDSENDIGRDDIIGIFDNYHLSDDGADAVSEIYTSIAHRNIAVYEQYFTITDNILTDKDIIVSPTYFLARLLPYNDNLYGVQYATAGLRRGILEDAIAVNENPSPSTKNSWFTNRINYVEKTSREYAFMSQRTHDGSTEHEYTALSFLNNSRVLEKMKRELERLGREYLFEFNDSITLTNMSKVLNKYVGQWVANRTLSYGEVEVAKNPYSDEAVDVRLNIRFNGTIEVISVDITIE